MKIDSMKVGEVQVDTDGSRWVIVGITTNNGAPQASRVLEGSLAHEVFKERDESSNR